MTAAKTAPTLEEIRAWPATHPVPRSCEALGISQSWGYELIKAGDFPCRVITIRSRSRVVTASLLKLLEEGE